MSQPPKVLLLYAHPESQDSVSNRVLLKPALELEHVTVHDLYAHYPDFFVDIHHEQQLLREHQIIIFQFPLHTFSCPALLKEWLDRVLSRGFANGAGGDALAGKYLRTVVTTGYSQAAYSTEGENGYSMDDILRPFELTAKLCHMRWLPPMVVYSARRQKPEMLISEAKAYREWLEDPLSSGGD